MTPNLPGLPTPIRSARGFAGGKVEVRQADGGTRLLLPDTLKDPVDSILVLRTKQ